MNERLSAAGSRRKTGGKLCKVCGHDGRAIIDAMLASGNYTADEIIAWEAEHYPSETPLNASNISRHKKNHPLWQSQGVELPPKAGAKALATVEAPRADISVRQFVPAPEERVTLAEATAIVLNLALQNAIRNPESVTLKDAAQFAELGRKLGLKGSEEDDFRKAWEELAGTKGKGAKKVKVKVTREVEASRDDGEPEPVVIDAEPVVPDTWAMPTIQEPE